MGEKVNIVGKNLCLLLCYALCMNTSCTLYLHLPPQDVSKDFYGISPRIQSQQKTGEFACHCVVTYNVMMRCGGLLLDRVWTRVGDLNSDLVGKMVLVRARVHNTRGTGERKYRWPLFYHCSSSQYLPHPPPTLSLLSLPSPLSRPREVGISCSPSAVPHCSSCLVSVGNS